MNDAWDILDYPDDIILNCRHARAFVSDMKFQEFRDDPKTTYAVIRALEILGEAAKHIPTETRSHYHHIPSRDSSGMRDKLIHAYASVNLAVVWKTVQEDLEVLESDPRMVRQSVASHSDDAGD